MADQKRAWNFALGLRLGSFQQGVNFGGRDRELLKDDLRSTESAGPLAGYVPNHALVASGLRKLNANLHVSTLIPEAKALNEHFQNQAVGVEARYGAALALGIVLGWLQQGADKNNRPLDLARKDLVDARLHAPNAGYLAYAPYLDGMKALLDAGHPVKALLVPVTALISLLQGQDLAVDPPADPAPPTDPAPPEGLLLHAASAYVGVNETIAFSTNVPPSQAGEVVWWSSDPNVLKPGSRPHEFRGAAKGQATVTARRGAHAASALIVVTGDSAIPVVPVPDPSRIALYPGTNVRVYRDEIICDFKKSVDLATQHAVLRQYGLVRLGVIPRLRSHLARFDEAQSTLPDLIARLSADARISHASAHPVLQYQSLPEHQPSEITVPGMWSHLSKIEAFPAFSLLRNVARTPQHVGFIDGGLWLDASGAAHIDYADRIDITRCASFGHLPVATYPVTLADLQEHGTDVFEGFHGSKVIGTAVAGWNNGGGVGLEPRGRVSLILVKSFFAAKAGVTWASGWINPGYRVVNITVDKDKGADPYKVRDPIVEVVDARGLVVIAACNYADEVTQTSFGSAHVEFKEPQDQPYRDAIIVVAATEPVKNDPEGPETIWSHSNFDSHRKYIDLAAPGVVRTSGIDHGATFDTGTSHAAPLVSAAAAVVFSILPGKDSAWVKKCLLDTSDPIQYVPQVYPPYRLWSSKYVGKGRLNLWQALLYALNEREALAQTKVRYAGLRITADRGDLNLFLELSNGTLLALGRSIVNEPHRTTATRVTMTNAENFSWPTHLIGREQGSITVVYRFKLPPPERTDQLKTRKVFTVRAYTGGRFSLTADSDQTVSHQRRFSILNLGWEAPDVEMEDPAKRSPWDESLRPWMKLANGDSFAIRVKPVQPSSGVTLAILDRNGQPFPETQKEDGDPYVTVPFKSGDDSFVIRAKFSGTGPAEVKVEVEVFSLNNRVVSHTAECTLRRGTIEGSEVPGFLNRPLHWWLFGELHFKNPGPGAVSTRLKFEPSAGWRAHYHEYPPWADLNLAPGEERRVRVRFSPEPGSNPPPGTKGTCDVISIDEEGNPTGYHHRFTGLIEPPPAVRIEPVSLQAESVRRVSGENYVFAEFPITMVNESKYTVIMRRYYHRVTGSPLSAVHKEPLQIDYPNINGVQAIAPGGRFVTKVRLLYDPGMVNPTNPVLARHRVTLLVEDPNLDLWLSPYPMPNYDGYLAQPFDVQVRLKLAGPAPPSGAS